jgi:hypothetical protein
MEILDCNQSVTAIAERGIAQHLAPEFLRKGAKSPREQKPGIEPGAA